MDPTDFLMNYVPGYAELSQPERNAITHFTLLWSAMEGRVLRTNANPTSLVNAVKTISERGQLNVNLYQASLDYFRNRYFQNGEFTYHFDQLLFRPRDQRALVEAVLARNDNDHVNIVAALLLVTYRLRNNLFHGVKWAYGIKGQQENFMHASEILMHMLEAHNGP